MTYNKTNYYNIFIQFNIEAKSFTMFVQNSDLLRFITIYIVQLGVGGILFILFAALVLLRSRKELNQIFSLFFISIAISTFFNVIYASLRINWLVKILHILTYYFFCWAMVFLLLFNLMVLKSEVVIHRKKQLKLILVWSLILLGLFIFGLLGGVKIDETTNWKPSWELSFFLYGIIVCIGFMIIPTIYFSIQVYLTFDQKELKKRWRLFILGTLIYYFIWGGASLVNFVANETFRSVWSIILLMAFFSIYILYYGVAKQLK